MAEALAYANNDVVLIAWQCDHRIPGCLGFALYRLRQDPLPGGAPGTVPSEPAQANAGQATAGPGAAAPEDAPAKALAEQAWTPLPAWVGFAGSSNAAWQAHDTVEWPVQKFEWKDVTAQRGATYRYRVVPMLGTPGALQADPAHALETGPVTLTPRQGAFAAFFNRGILSTQYLVHALPSGASGTPDFQALKDHIGTPGDSLRNALAGDLPGALQGLLRRAASEGGSCFLALYELNDEELLDSLLNTPRLHVILSNTGTDDAENKPARARLHAQSTLEIIDRFVPGGHIGHNKFCVYVDAGGTAQAVLLGSTNWTSTGLCAQSNNALVAEDAHLAQAYLAYWQRLRADTGADGKGPQGPQLRTANALPGAADIPVGSGVATVWFSPNTPHARATHPAGGEVTPPDLGEVFALMAQARDAILFLEFEPGNPSVISQAAAIGNQNPSLFIRGAVTDPQAVQSFNTTLMHRSSEDPVEVVPATAIDSQFAFWEKELLKAGPSAHAIIHDKIVVIDPFSDHCVVITGSHNQGYRASYNNDENLLIVRGHRGLAAAYAVHVMDVYDHYRFRYIQQSTKDAFAGLSSDDGWQDKYFDASQPASKEVLFWMGNPATP